MSSVGSSLNKNREEHLFQAVVILQICYSRYYYFHFISNMLTTKINKFIKAEIKIT